MTTTTTQPASDLLAHLTRNVRALAEAGIPERPWATNVITQIDRLFAAWHVCTDGTTDRAGLQAALRPIQQALQDAFVAGTQCPGTRSSD